MISKPKTVKALADYKLYLSFEDGTKGEVDLNHLKDKGIFELWSNYDNFINVYIDQETDAIAWSSEVEIDPTSLYLKIIGKSFEEWKNTLEHAENK